MAKLTDKQISNAIVEFEARLFSNQPLWETREEYQVYAQWMEERKQISNAFKALLVSGNIQAAKELAKKTLK